MVNSRAIADLDPAARDVCNTHLALCHLHGIELIVTSTWRDFAAQDALYAIGRTIEKNRKAVTNAKAGQSWHQFKCAWDVVPVMLGKPIWDPKDPVWKEVIHYGKQAGAEAGADWPSFRDLPHFQMRPTVQGLRIALHEALDRFQSTGTIFT